MGGHDVGYWVERFSYPAVILLCWACGVGAPLSEDLILLTAGTVVARTSASFPLMVGSAWLGQLGGDVLLFGLGRRFGPRALRLPGIRRLLSAERVARVRDLFARRGVLFVMAARFLPGLRAPTYLIAGTSGLSAGRFLLADGAAASVAAPLMVYLGYRFGPAVLALIQRASRGALIALFLGGLALIGLRRWRARIHS